MHHACMNEPTMTQNADGTKMWFLHGALHRENAPAVERAGGTKAWWLHYKLHREDGAAVEFADGIKQWWLHDKYYSDAQSWAEALLKKRNQPSDDASIDAFLKQVLQKQVDECL